MKVLNKVKMRNCDQWLADFVTRAVKKSKINCKKVVIDSMEDRMIHLIVDGDEETYKIILMGSEGYEYDDSNIPCSDKLQYVLFKLQGDTYTGISDGTIKVKWKNRFEEHFPNEAIKTVIADALDMVDKGEGDIQAFCCVDSCIAVVTQDANYKISISKFPVFAYDRYGAPAGYEVEYLLEEAVVNEKKADGYIYKIIGNGVCELLEMDSQFYERLKNMMQN